MNNRFQVIFFDAADTLFHVHGSVADIYLRHAVNTASRRTRSRCQKFRPAFGRAFRDAPPPVFAATEPAQIKQSERLWWFDIVHNVFYRVGMFERFDEFFEQVFDVFRRPDHGAVSGDACRCWTGLKAQEFELGIISNFDSRLFAVLRGLGIAEYLRYGDHFESGPCRETIAPDFSSGLGETCGRSGRGLSCRRQPGRDDVKGAQNRPVLRVF